MLLIRTAQKLWFMIGSFAVAACSSSSTFISADQHHIVVVPPTKELLEADRPAAATPEAEAHCQKFGRHAVLRDTKTTEGKNPKVVSVYFECAVAQEH
jgi:hypothetical protein